MLTDLKVSSLACKRMFNRPENNPKGGDHMELNFEDFEIQKDRAQRVTLSA